MIKVSAPVRIDISAGWPDSDPYRKDFGGSVLNAAINLRTEAVFDKKLTTGLGGAEGYNGLGASGAVDSLWLAAKNPNLAKNRMSLTRKVWDLQNNVLEQRGGLQDQAAAIYGGVNLWSFGSGPGENASIRREQISQGNADLLQDRIVLVDTGESHISSNIHNLVFGPEIYEENIPKLDRMGEIARQMKDLLPYQGNGRKEEEFAYLIKETWDLQKSLHESIETDKMVLIQRAAHNYSLACRATGAGGGGCMMFYTNPSNIGKLQDALSELDGVNVLPFKFDYRGLEVEKS